MNYTKKISILLLFLLVFACKTESEKAKPSVKAAVKPKTAVKPKPSVKATVKPKTEEKPAAEKQVKVEEVKDSDDNKKDEA